MFSVDNNFTKLSELWANVKTGNKKALSDLYELYADALYEFGKSYTVDGYLVEDCIHDLFVELYMGRKNLPVVRNVKNYLFTILKRKITKSSKISPLVISPEDDHPSKIYRNPEVTAETEIIHNEENEEIGLLISNMIQTLTPKQKTGVFMRFYENRSYEEIALGLDISRETARTLIYKSLKRMRENFS